jgi:hypothetical protein
VAFRAPCLDRAARGHMPQARRASAFPPATILSPR